MVGIRRADFDGIYVISVCQEIIGGAIVVIGDGMLVCVFNGFDGP